MSVTIDTANGIATVELPAGRKKEPRPYEVRAVAPVDGWRSWAVEQVGDTLAEHHHTVGTDGERWRCSCRDFFFKSARWEEGCKHCRAVREVIEFYKKMTGG